MRLLATLSNLNEVERFSRYLTSQGISNKVDAENDTDWGSPHYGSPQYRIWIIDEDQIESATQQLEQFQNDPSNPIYNKIVILPPRESINRKPYVKPKPKTPILTSYLIAICALIFAWSALISPQFKLKDSSQTYSPIFTSQIKQVMLFDFPKNYEILNQLVQTYGLDTLQNTSTLPQAGLTLVKELKNTPSWQGYYEEALSYITTGAFLPEAPWFEKISQGEIWRFVSPIFLHGDIFHLLFNMAWLYILGRQLEFQLKPVRYILFILITAALTNTAQYLMSGPNFIGFSGVICAMLSFIWERQKAAPWEGYQIQKSTFNFMMIFIFGMVALQSLAFTLEATTGQTIPTSIANSAHVFGLIFGFIFSKVPYFTKRQV